MAMASAATAAMAALADDNRGVAFLAIQASGESQYREEHRDHHGQQDEAAAGEGEQPHHVARQSSLLALTLEEIQNTMCEPGKNFGSMNMDEFLSNIWTAEEGTAMAGGGGARDGAGDASGSGGGVADHNEHSGGGGGGTDAAANDGTPPASPCRQSSVSLPANLCRKTVDEVWSEIQRDQQQQPSPPHPPPPPPPPPPRQGHMQPHQYQSSGSAPSQRAFGEMTLEDFLIKAGVVREGGYHSNSSPQRLNQFPLPTSPPPPPPPPQNPYGMPVTYSIVSERVGYGPIQMTMGYGDHQDPAPTANGAYQSYHQQQQGGVGNGYGGGGVGYRGSDSGGGRMGNGHVGVGSPVSPVSSDGFGGCGQVDNSGGNPGGPWRADVGGRSRAGGGGGGARKRILDGPVDKVMERRQRRMIKNRESAARSRARKQAYTVELETELNHLKEENARLQDEQLRLAARRRQMLLEAMAERARTNSRKNVKALRRSSSCIW